MGVSLGVSNAPTVSGLTGGSVSLGAGGGAVVVVGGSAYTSFNPNIRGAELFVGAGLKVGTGITSPFAIEGFVNTTSAIVSLGGEPQLLAPSVPAASSSAAALVPGGPTGQTGATVPDGSAVGKKTLATMTTPPPPAA